jgi:hypothetical protein
VRFWKVYVKGVNAKKGNLWTWQVGLPIGPKHTRIRLYAFMIQPRLAIAEECELCRSEKIDEMEGSREFI